MDYFLHIAIIASIFAILAMSLNYIAGYTGIISLCHAAFFGIGAYTLAIFTKNYEFSFLFSFLLAMVISSFLAFIASFFLLRVKEDSLLLVSFGFAIIVYNLMLNLTFLTNGPLGMKGIPSASIFGINLFYKPYFLIFCLFCVFITWLILTLIVKSPYGTTIKGIRENDLIVDCSGRDSFAYKRSVFVLGGSFAGLAGALFAPYISYIDPNLFDLNRSVVILIMVIFGGMGNIWASIIGATVLTIFPEFLRFVGIPNSIMAESQQILYGLLLFTLIYLRPKGLFGEYEV